MARVDGAMAEQSFDGDISEKRHILAEHLADSFSTPIACAMAYGSAIFKQSENNQQCPFNGNMVDLIFLVDDPIKWHRANIDQNPGHYSWLFRWCHLVYFFGLTRSAIGRFIAEKVVERLWVRWMRLFQHTGAGIFYNTGIDLHLSPGKERESKGRQVVNHVNVKYGVMASARLLADLDTWPDLFMPGRLHKPILQIYSNIDGLSGLLQQNHVAAFRTAFLMLPERTSVSEMWTCITSLSYSGDLRMICGVEKKDKLYSIATSQRRMFEQIYADIYAQCRDGSLLSVSSDSVERGDTVEDRRRMLKSLPSGLKRKLSGNAKRRLVAAECANDENAVLDLLAQQPRPLIAKITAKSVSDLVRWVSIAQTVKGFFTSGPFNAILYAARKSIKTIRTTCKSRRREHVVNKRTE